MKDEKVLTLEEMKAKYQELGEEIAQKEKAEAEIREVKFMAEKVARRKEVDEAFAKYVELHKAYEQDYGTYVSKAYINEFPWHLFWN